MSVNIKYKNNSIATLTDTGTKTLKTSGKYCEADIIVENTKEAGGGAKIYTEKVTFSKSIKSYTIEHNLGVIPNFCLFSVLDKFEYLGVESVASMFCGILDGSMIYAASGTGNTGTSTEGYASVSSLRYTDKTYEHLEPISGMSIIVPYRVNSTSILLHGITYKMPAGTYFIMCGIM